MDMEDAFRGISSQCHTAVRLAHAFLLSLSFSHTLFFSPSRNVSLYAMHAEHKKEKGWSHKSQTAPF